MDLGGLAVRISCGDALAECLEASHLRLQAAPGVVSGPVALLHEAFLGYTLHVQRHS